ncbi:MAG: methyltransferase [Isosphaera sp.]|nr:methyltransferase [Isosphaera sp.]
MGTDARELVTAAVLGPGFRRATFGGATRGDTPSPWVRVVVRPVEVRGGPLLQFSYFDARKDTTRNYPVAEAAAPLAEVLAVGFSGVHVATDAEEIDVRTTKKGKVLVGRRKAAGGPAAAEPHNRVKDVPLPEGKADRLLEVMGIATADGRVRPAMRAKFTQINEFLKQLRHALADANLAQVGRPLDILDCGCGSSYLTLAAHHYLNDILGVPARLLGVDVNEEVIQKSVAKGERVAAGGLSFACGRIGELDAKPDVVLALHACDTATDDAIAQAVRGGAKLLLSVPCCHHALNRELRPDGPAEVLRPLLRHGILRERTADLVTDGFRALALRVMGHRTDVVEFVGTEHTARNLMIRAVKGLPSGDPGHVAEYRDLKRFWGVTPYIETALGEPFRDLVGG